VDVPAAAGTGEQLAVAATVLLPDGLAGAPASRGRWWSGSPAAATESAASAPAFRRVVRAAGPQLMSGGPALLRGARGRPEIGARV